MSPSYIQECQAKWYDTIATHIQVTEVKKKQLEAQVREFEARLREANIKNERLHLENLRLNDELRRMHMDCERRYIQLREQLEDSEEYAAGLEHDLDRMGRKVDRYVSEHGNLTTPSTELSSTTSPMS